MKEVTFKSFWNWTRFSKPILLVFNKYLPRNNCHPFNTIWPPSCWFTSLNVRIASKVRPMSWTKLILETLTCLAVNAATISLFVLRPFRWEHEPEAVQRFMWWSVTRLTTGGTSSYTQSGAATYSERFCNMFSESSIGRWAVLQLPCCLSKLGGTFRKHSLKQVAAPDWRANFRHLRCDNLATFDGDLIVRLGRFQFQELLSQIPFAIYCERELFCDSQFPIAAKRISSHDSGIDSPTFDSSGWCYSRRLSAATVVLRTCTCNEFIYVFAVESWPRFLNTCKRKH